MASPCLASHTHALPRPACTNWRPGCCPCRSAAAPIRPGACGAGGCPVRPFWAEPGAGCVVPRCPIFHQARKTRCPCLAACGGAASRVQAAWRSQPCPAAERCCHPVLAPAGPPATRPPVLPLPAPTCRRWAESLLRQVQVLERQGMWREAEERSVQGKRQMQKKLLNRAREEQLFYRHLTM